MMNAQTELAALLAAAEPLIDLAIAEDIGPGDATSASILDPNLSLHGCIVSKAPGVIAGLPVAEAVFRKVALALCEPEGDSRVTFETFVSDGQEVVAGECIAEVTGPAPLLLAAERIALNFLQRMSGVATLTREFVDAVAPTEARILDTRKTLPGYRILDKYAVRMGGGFNHRMALYDMLLVKDNHIDAAAGITPAVVRAVSAYPDLPIEIEVRDLEELFEALKIEPTVDRILLDNMSLSMMREAVRITEGRTALEASGGVTLSEVADIAATGVDYVSVGALTHSVQALDLSMKVHPKSAQALKDRFRKTIREVKAVLGKRLVILGHHYQRDAVLAFADFRGDSLQLARSATQADAEFIVFCGVHFMAEVAAILAQPGQRVLSPVPEAGCYLADTATLRNVRTAWEILDDLIASASDLGGVERECTPITYVNSSAALKAFCGEHGGTTSTSSNAEAALRWAFEQRPRVFFFPDQHLGRNTAQRMGLAPDEILLWNRYDPPDAEAVQKAKVILWPGACNVHQRFIPEHVHAVRARDPNVRVMVHPECKAEVVALADEVGSTAHIIAHVEDASPGTHWAIGTETRLVKRLQKQHPAQTIESLANVSPFCASMSQVTLANLAQVLEVLLEGAPLNEVTVDLQTVHWAKIALERMLTL
jgi:quinolinate synthase